MIYQYPASCTMVLLCCLLWVARPTSATAQTEKDEYGTVELLVMDTYGNPLRSFEGTVTTAGGSGLSRQLRSNAETITLPYGPYVIRGRASLHHPLEREFLLREPRLLVTVALPFHDPGESRWVYAPPLNVSVRNLPAGRGRIWVRFISLMGEFTKEAAVKSSGEVAVNEVPFGDYIVLLFRDSQLLKTARFRRTLRDFECSIDLTDNVNSRK
jgi:hypothetical protein